MASSVEHSLSRALGSGAVASLFRGTDGAGKPCLIKVANSRPATPEEIQLFQRDYEAGKILGPTSPNVLSPAKLDLKSDTPLLFLDNFPGSPLADSLEKPLPLGNFLDIAINITQGVLDIHDAGYIHGFLNPRSILLDPATNEIRITDFILATPLQRKSPPLLPSCVSREFAFISPEQSGRMSRHLDNRTDFYSLGVVFYQMLSARLPFVAEDALGWFHAHMTTVPPPLSRLIPGIPETVDLIVGKLLSKMPESRYQSARGLLFDLERCRELLQKSGGIEAFPIGAEERGYAPAFPRKLYGREPEMRALEESWRQVAGTGRMALALVSGFSGVGKSSLVQQLEATIKEGGGRLAAGKFDQQHGGTPYFTVVSALREIILEILAGEETSILSWQGRISSQLGENSFLLAELIPELSLLAGEKEQSRESETLSATERELRLLRSIQAFIGLIATADHPLALFLDDLQWADPATLKLLERFATDHELPHVLLIGSYRDNEVGKEHPLTGLVERIKKLPLPMQEIRLRPLSPRDLRSLVADSLGESSEQVAELADLIFMKTAGNPFFAQQFLKSVHAEGLLRFEGKAGRWKWDVSRIEAEGYSDSAVDLMLKVISRLPANTRRVLTLASFLGNRFTVPVLAAVAGEGNAEVLQALKAAEKERLIAKSKEAHAFQHDRIQQAAYLLAPEPSRARMHLFIGRTLRALTLPNELEQRIFDIVNQLNLGVPEITDAGEKADFAALNLMAGRKAKDAAAHSSALAFFECGLSLLGVDPWAGNYPLAYSLFLESAECAYLAGRFDLAEKRLAEAVKHASSPMEKAQAYSVWLNLYTTTGEMRGAIATGFHALEALGWSFPRAPSREETAAATSAIWEALRGREPENLIDLPLLRDQRMLISLKILNGMLLPAHFVGGNLNHFITAQMVLISVRHGISPESVLAFSWFAATLVDREVGRYRDGYRFGKLSYDLLKKHSFTSCVSRVCLFFGDIVNFYSRPLREDRAFILEGFNAGNSYGDLVSACYLCNHMVTNMLAAADPLEQVWQESERRLDFVRKAKDPNIERIITSQQRFVLCLLGKTHSPFTFTGPGFSEEEFEREIASSEMTLMKFWYFSLKMQARFFHGDTTAAMAAAVEAGRYSGSDRFDMESTQFFFFSSLVLADFLSKAPPEERDACHARLLAQRDQLRAWNECCPENFENRLLLVSAEIARIEGSQGEAFQLFEAAIHSAEKHGFWQNAALACELACRFHKSVGLAVSAQGYRARALHFYRRWGAHGKVAALQGEAAGESGGVPSGLGPADSALASFSRLVDLNAVIKAQRAISSELVPENLYQAILRLALENAGAQRGALLIPGDESLVVQVELDGEKTTSPGVPLAESHALPHSIIHYVARLKRRILLHDARSEHLFASDEYVRSRRPLSVLCLPILRQQDLLAVLYLENNLATRSFTSDSLALLEMLASQAAISIENARLYEDLRRSVKTRDEFMAIASHELKSPLSSASIYVQTLRLIIQKRELAKYPEEKLLRLLDSSSNSIRNLANLIDQLLDFTRFTLGHLTLHPEPMDLGELAREAAERFAKDLANARCPLQLDLESGVVGSWDRFRLEQIFNNLLSNAVKYAAGKAVALRVKLVDGRARVVIQDRGIGISAEDRKRLFRPFERAVPYRSISGFGLGLYIVRKVVEAHQGRIDLESEPGKGTTFTIDLPLNPMKDKGEIDAPR